MAEYGADKQELSVGNTLAVQLYFDQPWRNPFGILTVIGNNGGGTR
jgi:hypothetical protein